MNTSINRLKYYRVERKLNQYELALESGVPRSSIQLYESGFKLPSQSHRLALAATLGVAAEDLFGSRPDRDPDGAPPSTPESAQLELNFNQNQNSEKQGE